MRLFNRAKKDKAAQVSRGGNTSRGGSVSHNGRQSIAPDVKPTGAVGVKKERRHTSRGIFSGDVLYAERVRRHYPFILYCCALIIVYMGYTFTCQRAQREEIACRIELQRLRSKALLFSSERLEAVGYNEIIEQIEQRGIKIKPRKTPPTIIRKDDTSK